MPHGGGTTPKKGQSLFMNVPNAEELTQAEMASAQWV